MTPRKLAILALLGLLSLAAPACTTYRDELSRAQTAYDANDHETALALTRVMEPNVQQLTVAEQTRYHYVRGMANFRVGFRAEARHQLAVARALEAEHSGALPSDWKNRLDETLGTLNTDVYSNGLASLFAAESEVAAKKPPKKK